ncbi:MAG: CD1871A family CXXC motif-containing protein [Acidobacteriota bacterium]|nr:CD1871A family CXXC motif-containing protein [Acidobacteriota bacterium]
MKRKQLWFWAVLSLAVLCIVFGLWAGEFQIVWQKARTICLECIGLG